MIRDIIHDPLFLSQKSQPAQESDRSVIADLKDTLVAHREHCVGMAANMIGVAKRIIVFFPGPFPMVMVNPRITQKTEPYEAQEGCLSLNGVRPAKRFQKITVQYQDESFTAQTRTFEGYAAQIIQHEIDHCDGILI